MAYPKLTTPDRFFGYPQLAPVSAPSPDDGKFLVTVVYTDDSVVTYRCSEFDNEDGNYILTRVTIPPGGGPESDRIILLIPYTAVYNIGVRDSNE